MNVRAQAGIGSLILFIALVLVAATAAAVFIQTSQSLQGKAIQTASNSQKQVSTRVQIISAWGENASATSTINDIYMKIKLSPGSDAVVLNKSYVSFSTPSDRQTYKFNQSSGCSSTNLSDSSNSAHFLVTGRIGYTKPGYIQDGDVIDVCFHTPTSLGSDTQITIGFAPASGTLSSFSTSTPSILVDSKTQLYP